MNAEETLTNNRGSVDEPVAVLPLALVRADSARINHCDCITSIEGDG